MLLNLFLQREEFWGNMKTNYHAIVVGGGVVGVSIAYHLALKGLKDVLLLERDELTSGSTWHAAGLLPLFNMSYATSHIHDYSLKLYPLLEKQTRNVRRVLTSWQSEDGSNE